MLLSILWACVEPVTETAQDSDSAVRPLLQMGRIYGSVTVGPSLEESLAEDRELAAALFVFASMKANENEVLPLRVHATAPIIEPLEEISIPFVLENLFPSENPYRVLALFDLDASTWSSGLFTATPGDLMSSPSLLEMEEVTVGSGDDLQVDLVIEHVQD
jgi:hypothetical protein